MKNVLQLIALLCNLSAIDDLQTRLAPRSDLWTVGRASVLAAEVRRWELSGPGGSVCPMAETDPLPSSLPFSFRIAPSGRLAISGPKQAQPHPAA